MLRRSVVHTVLFVATWGAFSLPTSSLAQDPGQIIQFMMQQVQKAQKREREKYRSQDPLAPVAPQAQVNSTSRLAEYEVGGFRLGQKVDLINGINRGFTCKPSDLGANLSYCVNTRKGSGLVGPFLTTNSLLLSDSGEALYINQSISPGLATQSEISRAIDTRTRQYGPPRVLRIEPRGNLPAGIIAAWGQVTLEPVDSESLNILASGQSPKKGFLADYLNDFTLSAQNGLPVYRLGGAAGYVWIGTFDETGRGRFRFLTIDASAFSPPASVAIAGNNRRNTKGYNSDHVVGSDAPVQRDGVDQAAASTQQKTDEPEAAIRREADGDQRIVSQAGSSGQAHHQDLIAERQRASEAEAAAKVAEERSRQLAAEVQRLQQSSTEHNRRSSQEVIGLTQRATAAERSAELSSDQKRRAEQALAAAETARRDSDRAAERSSGELREKAAGLESDFQQISARAQAAESSADLFIKLLVAILGATVLLGAVGGVLLAQRKSRGVTGSQKVASPVQLTAFKETPRVPDPPSEIPLSLKTSGARSEQRFSLIAAVFISCLTAAYLLSSLFVSMSPEGTWLLEGPLIVTPPKLAESEDDKRLRQIITAPCLMFHAITVGTATITLTWGRPDVGILNDNKRIVDSYAENGVTTVIVSDGMRLAFDPKKRILHFGGIGGAQCKIRRR